MYKMWQNVGSYSMAVPDSGSHLVFKKFEGVA